jgi:hypothetical protein
LDVYRPAQVNFEKMRIPIRLKAKEKTRWFEKFISSITDPRMLICDLQDIDRRTFSKLVSSLRTGITWKSTSPARHQRTDELIMEICSDFSPVILDVGASDGITSLELIEKLGSAFTMYYVTDVSFNINIIEQKPNVYFYDSCGKCFLISTRKFLVYSDFTEAYFPLKLIAKKFFAFAPVFNVDRSKQISLIQPDLLRIAKQDARVSIEQYSIFDPWTKIRPDIIKAANILNRTYFSDDQIRSAITNFKTILKEGGKLIVTDNRDEENVSLFYRDNNSFKLQRNIGKGTEIKDIVLSL